MIHYRQHKFITKLFTGIGLLMTILLPFSAVKAEEPALNSEWQYMVDIYLWGASIGGTSATGNDIDISFNDLISNLDMGLMGTIGARKNKWSFLADIIYMDVSDDQKGSFSLPDGSGIAISTELDVNLKSWVVQPVVGYQIYENEKSRLDLTAGARYLWMETTLKLEATGPQGTRKIKASDSGDNWDGILGARGELKLSEKWFVSGYLDVGTGQSDYTWQGLAMVGYKFKKVDAALGYRYLKWKFDDNDVLDDLTLEGPFAGVRFSF